MVETLTDLENTFNLNEKPLEHSTVIIAIDDDVEEPQYPN